MRWRLISIVVALAAVGLMVSVVLGVWTGTQTASGTVNATTSSPDLYLCEAEGEGIGCGQDDSGPNEIIFEGLEDLLPGSFASSNLRLRNIGANPLDVVSVEPVVTETADPGNDCEVTPEVKIGVLGQVPYPAEVRFPHLTPSINDNHGSQFANANGLQLFVRAVDDPLYINERGFGMAVHIDAGDYEDFRVDVILLTSAPDACEENVWDITIAWDVVSVGHGS